METKVNKYKTKTKTITSPEVSNVVHLYSDNDTTLHNALQIHGAYTQCAPMNNADPIYIFHIQLSLNYRRHNYYECLDP